MLQIPRDFKYSQQWCFVSESYAMWRYILQQCRPSKMTVLQFFETSGTACLTTETASHSGRTESSDICITRRNRIELEPGAPSSIFR